MFIGGNGVGKTTFLSELFASATAAERLRWHWLVSLQYTSDDVAADLRLIKSSLWRQSEGTSFFYHSQAVKNKDGNAETSPQFRYSTDEYSTFDAAANVRVFDTVKYRRPLIAYSSCDARLGLQNEAGMTGNDQPPQDPVNVLYRNKKLLKEIDAALFKRFKKHFVLLDHIGTKLEMGVSDEEPPTYDGHAEDVQAEYLKVEEWKRQKLIPLTEAGHGIRSMIRLLTSLLEPVNQVIVIDEPEMHLYPSQKRWLGRQLVKLAKERSKQVFLVTHDPMVLQGILDANAKTNIFRVDRDERGQGAVNSCEIEKITDANAMRNQDQYLQGLFYQRCIVVEGASDRSFYQNMVEDYPEIEDKDLGFVACGGKASSVHVARTMTKVKVRASFIFDFDVLLWDNRFLSEVFALCGGTADPLAKLMELFDTDDTIKKTKEDGPRKKLIHQLTGYNERNGMTSAWALQNKAVFDEVIATLAAVGIFIVPAGSLESWAPEVEQKVRFAEQAPDAIRASATLRTPFKDFARRVLGHLEIVIP